MKKSIKLVLKEDASLAENTGTSKVKVQKYAHLNTPIADCQRFPNINRRLQSVTSPMTLLTTVFHHAGYSLCLFLPGHEINTLFPPTSLTFLAFHPSQQGEFETALPFP